MGKIYYHLPGLFEFYEFYKVFLELFRNHREYFYDWCEIGSIYGVSRERIRQIENRAISKLKKLCKNKNLTSGLKNYFGG